VINIENISNQELDLIDLDDLSLLIKSDEYRSYFVSKSSMEHYRLLSYISMTNDNISILDIGTYKGCSALAFSKNENNHVNSFNLVDEKELIFTPKNVSFFVDDILSDKYISMIMTSPVILLDTYHDGSFELKFYQHLVDVGYKGVLLLDDIKLNSEMINFWNSIRHIKNDASNIGHITGTGVVYFE